MKVLINFADDNFRKSQKLNSFTGKHIGGFDKIYEFSPADIDDKFLEENKAIFEQKRGCGYWLWKPYFILKVIEQQSEGDYIFYCDSGSFFIRDIKYLINILNQKNNDVLLFELPLVECEWSNEYLIKRLNLCDDKYRLSNQILGTYICLKKSQESISFIQKYLLLCTNEDLLTDKHTVLEQCAFDHRHDQSILSLLAKKEGIIPEKDPSDYGAFPFRYFSKGRLFRVKNYDNNYPVTILSNRKESPIKYYLKFVIRSLLRKNS